MPIVKKTAYFGNFIMKWTTHLGVNTGRFCADPHKIHKKKFSNSLCDVTTNLISRNSDLNLTLQHKVCINCLKKIK